MDTADKAASVDNHVVTFMDIQVGLAIISTGRRFDQGSCIIAYVIRQLDHIAHTDGFCRNRNIAGTYAIVLETDGLQMITHIGMTGLTRPALATADGRRCCHSVSFMEAMFFGIIAGIYDITGKFVAKDSRRIDFYVAMKECPHICTTDGGCFYFNDNIICTSLRLRSVHYFQFSVFIHNKCFHNFFSLL